MISNTNQATTTTTTTTTIIIIIMTKGCLYHKISGSERFLLPKREQRCRH
jgi:hypothetical protein